MKKEEKIGLERIYRLFELAEKEQDTELKKKYLKLAKRIGEKVNVSIPKELKKKFCKKCYSMNVEEIEKDPFLIIKCKECKFETKYSLRNK
jgi:ribonuclease P protein subunit RPR2